MMQFLAMIILARLLTPDDFAIMGVVLFFVSISAVLLDSGMGGSLVRKKDVKDIDYSTLFIFNASLGIIIYIILLLTANIIADFYKMRELAQIINIIGISIVISALGKIQNIILIREFKFKELSIISTVSNLIALIFAIVLATRGFGVWALVMQNLTQSILVVGLQFTYNRYIPKIKFSLTSLKEQWDFGVHLLLSQSIYTIYQNIFSLIFPKISTLHFSGLYVQANKIQQIPSNISSSVIQTVAFPILAKIDDPAHFKSINRRFIRQTYLVVFTILCAMAIFSRPLITIILGTTWIDAAPILSILAISGLGYIIMFMIRNTFKSMGVTRMILRLEIIKVLTGLIFIACVFKAGDYMILLGIVLASFVATAISIFLLSKKSNYSQKEQYYDIFRSLQPAVIPMIIIIPLILYWSISTYISILCVLPLYTIMVFVTGVLLKNQETLFIASKIRCKMQRVLHHNFFVK